MSGDHHDRRVKFSFHGPRGKRLRRATLVYAVGPNVNRSILTALSGGRFLMVHWGPLGDPGLQFRVDDLQTRRSFTGHAMPQAASIRGTGLFYPDLKDVGAQKLALYCVDLQSMTQKKLMDVPDNQSRSIAFRWHPTRPEVIAHTVDAPTQHLGKPMPCGRPLSQNK